MKKHVIIQIIILISITYTYAQKNYWEIVNTPNNIDDIRSIESDVNGNIYIGIHGASGGIRRSVDQGNSWELIGFENSSVGQIEINELGFIYAWESASNGLSRSADDGQTWDVVYNDVAGGLILESFPDGIIFTSGQIGNQSTIMRSFDYGYTWEHVFLFAGGVEFPYAIVIQSIDSIYVGTIKFTGDGGGVYRSIDGGDTWEHIGLFDHYVSSLAMNSNGDLFAGTRGHYSLGYGGVFILPKGQAEWVNLSDDELVTSMSINSDDDIFIGCSTLDGFSGGVQISTDNGQSWEQLPTDIMSSGHIKDVMIDSENYLYAMEENSSTPLYKSINSTITALQEKPTNKDIITYNYPNPFSTETIIHYSLSAQQENDVQIIIYDSFGRILKKIIIPNSINKKQEIKFSPKHLSSGIYYYEIVSDKNHTFNKMVLQK